MLQKVYWLLWNANYAKVQELGNYKLVKYLLKIESYVCGNESRVCRQSKTYLEGLDIPANYTLHNYIV